jgi:hypothetical protein
MSAVTPSAVAWRRRPDAAQRAYTPRTRTLWFPSCVRATPISLNSSPLSAREMVKRTPLPFGRASGKVGSRSPVL